MNDDIAQVRAAGDWPALFTLTGQYPGAWTPVDSLVVQGVLTQELDYTTGPLDYALLDKSLGSANTADWFPVLAKNAQTPYDPGPYVKAPLTTVPPDVASSAPAGGAGISPPAAPGSSTVSGGAGGGGPTRSADPGAVAGAAASVLDQLSQLLPGQIHHFPDSNAWAANGPAVAGASADQPRALLGGDPQNSATFYYKEQVRGSRYFWNGAWRPLTVARYSIPVRGGATRQLTVDITAHGPIISQAGQTMAVDWMGNVPSGDVAALFAVNTASTFAQFKAALAGWHAPAQNFVYADTAGNIGVVAPGYYPQVPGCLLLAALQVLAGAWLARAVSPHIGQALRPADDRLRREVPGPLSASPGLPGRPSRVRLRAGGRDKTE